MTNDNYLVNSLFEVNHENKISIHSNEMSKKKSSKPAITLTSDSIKMLLQPYI